MNALFRRAEQRNVRGGRILPLTVVLLSVLAFVASILLVSSAPTYAEPILAVDSVEPDEAGDNSSMSGLSKEGDVFLEKQGAMSGSVSSESSPKQEPSTDSAREGHDSSPEAPHGDGFVSANLNNESEVAGSEEGVTAHSGPLKKSANVGSPFRRARGASSLTCKQGVVYAVTRSGAIMELRQGQLHTEIARVPFLQGIADNNKAANALGISATADSMYVLPQWRTYFNPRTFEERWSYAIYKYTPSTQTWTQELQPRDTGLPVPFIAGAVQLSNGNFYFGSFKVNQSNGDRKIYFQLKRFDTSSKQVVDVGSFFTGQYLANGAPFNTAANGDIAFDDAGNLFIVRSGSGTTNIFSVAAEDLASANGGYLPASATTEITPAPSATGIAFDASGQLFIGNAGSVKRHDPIDFEELGGFVSNLHENTDLATCASPVTVHVRKNVIDRAQDADQFVLSLTKSNGQAGQSPFAQVTTTGRKKGIQKEMVGVFPIRTTSRIKIAEKMAKGSPTSLSRYRTSWECVGPWRQGQNPRGTSSEGTFVVPDVPSAKIVCTFTNEPNQGSLTWEKVDGSDRSTYLEGSVWSLNGPLAQGRSGTVMDCVAADASQCRAADNDTDPRAGYFKVDGLYLGRYTLREQTPPRGYEATTQTFTRELTEDRQQLSFGQIGNKKLVAQIQVKKKVLDPEGGQVPDASGWTLAVDLETNTTGTLSPLADTNSKWFGKHQVSDASGIVPEKWTISFPNSGSRQNIRVTEGAKADNYEASIECTSNKRAAVKGAGAGLNVNDVQPGESLTCVVTNKQKPGSVAWEKTDPSGAHLSGSEWQLRMPEKGTVTVKDCVKAGACQGLHDSDPQPGRFRVDGLKWGAGSLTELTSPPGYRRDGTARTFTIREGALQANVGRITNEPVEVPPLPFTGGMSADSFLIAGSAVLAIAFVFALMRGAQQSNGARVSTRLVHRRVKEEG